MTSLLDRGAPSTGQRGSGDPEALLPARPHGKRPLLAAASAVVVVTSIAGFMSLYSSARRQQEVVVVTRTIEVGESLSAADLGQTGASLSAGVQAIPVSMTAMLSGKRAAETVPAGSLLVPADVTSAPAIRPGDAVVGTALRDGQYPASGLQPGDEVMVVETASPGSPLPTAAGGSSLQQSESAGPTAGTAGTGTGSTGTAGSETGGAGVLVPQASVLDTTAPGTGSGGTVSELVSVEVPTALASTVSTAAAAGQVSLVLLPDVGSGTTGGGGASNGGGSQ